MIVGGGGFVMLKVTVFERDGVASEVFTVTAPVPTATKSAAGIVAESWRIPPLRILNTVETFVPFHCTREVRSNPVPRNAIVVFPVPATAELGVTEVITGVDVGGSTLRRADTEIPPPGAGLTTLTEKNALTS